MQVQYFHLTLKIKGREEKEEAERVKALSLYVKVRHVAFALYYVIGVRRRVLSVKSHCPCPDGAVSGKFREKHAQNNQ